MKADMQTHVTGIEKEMLASAKAAREHLTRSLDDLRTQIKAMKSERVKIANMPVEPSLAKDRAAVWVGFLVKSYGDDMTFVAHFMSPKSEWRQPTMALHERTMVSCLSKFVLEDIFARIDAAYQNNSGITDDDRRAQLEVIDRKILDAELAEESLLRSAEQAGFRVMRRADANPLAVLAHDSALP